MLYFGPWDRAGHHMFNELGESVHSQRPRDFPWDENSPTNGIDCQLQPGCYKDKRDGYNQHGEEIQGQALLHHKNGWTALSFWDRSVDTRGGCNSTYFAKGNFTFDQMVEMSKTRFAFRWNKMKFEVKEVKVA
jgi:hypothetical protein